ncbi:response regulator transcription factor [Dyadobacter sp. CY345]|uniref:LuxR C-terminal-related transcriptional regulator n=1 Tax=Dyadobacter sp. CY345 TaxID=2909335 RepID=UPI001F185AB8|nr:response regulator transcription factor [Dyadobacter sp. CY345]MCF2443607.1 response regulator transcription factor [Dyadobacter sp. CY345]
MTNFKILFIDNSFVVRAGLEKITKDYVSLATSFKSLSSKTSNLSKIKFDSFDLVIIGAVSTVTTDVIEYVKQPSSKTRILIFSRDMKYSDALDCLLAGANGFLTQNAGCEEIAESIVSVLGGHQYLCRALMEQMAQETLTENIRRSKTLTGNPKKWSASPVYTLSRRQFQIAQGIIQGQSTSTIAYSLGIANSTLATHKSILFKKLGVNNLPELVDKYYDELNSTITKS